MVLCLIVLCSLFIKAVLILKYKNLLTLSSDDLNYIKSAVALLRKGIFVFHNYNEPTVFVMPLYPLFLAGIFKAFGYGLVGMQAVRLLQAVLSSLTIIFIFLIAKRLFDTKTALFAAFLVGFYLPNIVTVGYMMTETLFTFLLTILIYYSLKFCSGLSVRKSALLGVIWAAITLCRPTIALYPVMLFFYIAVYLRPDFFKTFKLGSVMLLVFVLIMAPWWVRNYREYGEFIPLAASSGNPMLQGTYIDYRQTPENVVYYKLGRNAYETNKTEVEVAKKRIREGFEKDFWGYLKWYTIWKTYYFWGTIFYWKHFFGIGHNSVLIYHYALLTGFAGILLLMLRQPLKYILPVMVILYFNVVHCVYMAFDRYAFPVVPLLSIFCSYFLFEVYNTLKNGFSTVIGKG